MVKGINSGESNGMWKGDDIEYSGLHYWVRKHVIKPQTCTKCGEGKQLEAHNISGEYKREVSDWEYMCRKCHMILDGRLERINTFKFCNKTSKYRGVNWHKSTRKWVAQIQKNKKRIYLGVFNTEEDAYKAYVEAKNG